MNKSFYIVGQEPKENVKIWLEKYGFNQVKSPKTAGIIVIQGDEEIDPTSYGMEKVAPFACSLKRDKKDIEIYQNLSPEQLVLGISRGAQLACIMNGGKIIQGCDKNFHRGNQTHPIRNGSGRIYEIPSSHTQLMFPYNLDSDKYELLYFCDPRGNYPRSSRLFGTGMDGSEFSGVYEPEIVLFKRSAESPEALAIQGHPELIPDSPVSKMIINLINDLIK